jgi:hypothetical protein
MVGIKSIRSQEASKGNPLLFAVSDSGQAKSALGKRQRGPKAGLVFRWVFPVKSKGALFDAHLARRSLPWHPSGGYGGRLSKAFYRKYFNPRP